MQTEPPLKPDHGFGYTIELSKTYVAPAQADLAGRLGVADEQITILHAVPVIWNNGAMGCPKPGMAYTQAEVPGYWAILEYQGKRYSYHASQRGNFSLCENAAIGPARTPPGGRYDSAV
ncbi:MAG: hypothetical protein KJO55_06500 [Gammaproteobacteria bacterium]|nr:hypothetical protein [Gammaproteobacteria bacterium]